MGLYEAVKEFYEFSDKPHVRVGTGFPLIDELIGGPAPGEIAMVLGRSYAGKSLMGQNIILNNPTVPSIFFSLEMPTTQAIARMFSIWADEPATKVQRAAETGSLPNTVWDMVAAFPFHQIIDEPSVTLDRMSFYVEKYTEEHEIRPEFVVIDYLELLGGAKNSGDGMLATEAQASRLKDWAKRESMRVFFLHQTNRQEPKWLPPTADSARWGGYTESDFVIGMWRPHWNPSMDYWEKLEAADLVCFNVLKNRAYGKDAEELRYRLTPSLRLEVDGNQRSADTPRDITVPRLAVHSSQVGEGERVQQQELPEPM